MLILVAKLIALPQWRHAGGPFKDIGMHAFSDCAPTQFQRLNSSHPLPRMAGLRSKATRTTRLQFTPRDCGQLSSDPVSRDQLFDVAPVPVGSLIKIDS